jgi:hypothetical protein
LVWSDISFGRHEALPTSLPGSPAAYDTGPRYRLRREDREYRRRLEAIV